MSNVLLEVKDFIATITINEPETLNALNSVLLEDLRNTFEQIKERKDIRVVVLTGAGRSFVAGANIKEMAELSYEGGKAFGERGASLFRMIETMPMPVIAAVNGFALGGGCELALACDIRIASERAKIGQPEVGLGICPGFSGTQRLPRLVGFGKAKELIYTGKTIGADEALAIGLVNQVFPHDSFYDEVQALAASIAKNAPIAVASSKKAINDGWDMDIEDAIQYEVELFARCFESKDHKSGMAAFLNKEKANFEGK